MSDIQTTAAPDGWKPTGGAGTVPKLVVPTHIVGLSGEENALLRELAEVWTRHASRNRTLTAYYEAKEPLVDFGLTVPKSIKDHYTPLGWARKAVDMLAELCVFEGFVSPGVDDPFELQDFMSRIGFTSVLQQAIQTALIHGCSFLSVVRDFDVILFLDRHDEVDEFDAVSTEVFEQSGLHCDFVFVDVQLVSEKFADRFKYHGSIPPVGQ